VLLAVFWSYAPADSRPRPVDTLPTTTASHVVFPAIAVAAPVNRKSDIPPVKKEGGAVMIESGTALHPALSPDGQSLAYVDMGHLYVRRLNSAYPIELGPTLNTPFWSPDSRSVAATVGKWLTRFDLAGGAPHQICESNTMLAGAWGSDGTILIGLRKDGIYRVPATGGELVRVTTVDPARQETRHLAPRFLPDGKHFLYVRASNERAKNMLYVGSLPSDAGKPIMPVQSNVEFVGNSRDASQGYLVYQDGGSLVAKPFDLTTLTAGAAAIPFRDAAFSTAVSDAAFGIAEFSVTTSAVAERGKSDGGILLIPGWLGRLKR
jgi:hypothetical protein